MMYTAKLKSSVSFFKDSVIDINAIDFWLQHANPLWSVNQALGKIIEKKSVAKDTVSLNIQVNRHFKMGVAGQHHPVFVEINGSLYERTYSLSQMDKSHVQLTVKKVSNGKVSTWLIDHAKKGDVLSFGQPYGEMSLDETAQNIVLLAAGSGITPMYSLLRYWSQHKHLIAKPVSLLYWVKTTEDAAFKAELEKIAQDFPKFSYKIFYTQAAQPDARLNQSDVEAYLNLSNSKVYACGPAGFVGKAQTLFVDAKDFIGEAFSLSPITTADTTGSVQVILSKSNQTLTIPKGQAILPSLEQHGIKPQFGCRMGVCNKCVCNKAQGATQNVITGLSNTEPNTQLKICVSTAQSNLTLDL